VREFDPMPQSVDGQRGSSIEMSQGPFWYLGHSVPLNDRIWQRHWGEPNEKKLRVFCTGTLRTFFTGICRVRCWVMYSVYATCF